jgi:hypothetical protein
MGFVERGDFLTMTVELLVLSGPRLGERMTFDREVVLVGGDRDCDVRFNVRQHPGVRNKRARLVADEFGWRLHNDGQGLWFLNQTVLAAAAAHPLRSGDIIRVSEFGPDLRFAMLSEATSTGENRT